MAIAVCACVCSSALSLSLSATSQDPPVRDATRENMMCVERLRFPDYPHIARSGRLEFSTLAIIALAKGAVSSIHYEQQSDSRDLYTKVFLPVLDDTIRSSRFAARCDGTQVRVQYVFKLTATPPLTASFFGFPNRVEVWSEPYTTR
jgi:hypothetical protein